MLGFVYLFIVELRRLLLQEKCDQMMEYIRKLRLCIKWFQELEGNYHVEQDKLRNLLESAEKKCGELGMISFLLISFKRSTRRIS